LGTWKGTSINKALDIELKHCLWAMAVSMWVMGCATVGDLENFESP
jgi:hypothetical protein